MKFDKLLQLLDALRWLKIDWDEGIDVGGPQAPYRQSQRTDIYQGVIDQLLASGHLYESFATGEEIEARNLEQGRDPKQGYDNFERDLTEEERPVVGERLATELLDEAGDARALVDVDGGCRGERPLLRRGGGRCGAQWRSQKLGPTGSVKSLCAMR